MKKDIMYELMKLIYSKWALLMILISAGIVAVYDLFIFYLINTPSMLMEGVTDGLAVDGITMLKMSYTYSNMSFVLAAIVAVYVSSHFNYGTLKNEISFTDNLTKLWVSKLLALEIGTLITAITCNLVSFAVGAALGGLGTGWTNEIVINLFSQLLYMFAYTAFFLCIDVLLKKTSLCILANLFLPTLINSVLSVFGRIGSNNIYLQKYWIESGFTYVANRALVGECEYPVYVFLAIFYVVLFGALAVSFSKKVEI